MYPTGASTSTTTPSLRPSEDSFGNLIHTFWAAGPLEQLTVTVEGEVFTENTGGVLSGSAERLPRTLFLRETALSKPDAAIREFAADTAAGAEPLDALHALMGALHRRMKFRTGVTDTTTAAKDAFAAAEGVCQDYTHIFLAAARSLGIPCRYVSGYLRHNDGRDTYEAGHGWAEAHVENLGWVGFDAANCISPDDSYIRVACGLDYLDAGPVRGVRHGVADEEMNVEINLTQGASQQ